MQVTWYNPLTSTPWRGNSSRDFLRISSRTCSSPDVCLQSMPHWQHCCVRSRQWKARYKLSKTIKVIMLRDWPLREILAIVILIIPLITGHWESSDLLRGNKRTTLWVTPNIPVTEGRLHEVVVMTLLTALVVVIIITATEGQSCHRQPALAIIIIIMFGAPLLGAPWIEWNHTMWFALDVVQRATCWNIAPTPHGCSWHK